MPPTRGASGWMKSALRWRISSPVLGHAGQHLAGGDRRVEHRRQRGVALGVVGVERLLDPGQVERLDQLPKRCAVTRSHCWLASTIMARAPIDQLVHRAARARRSIIGSGWPTLILMPPMPRSSRACDVLQHLARSASTGSRPRCCSTAPSRGARRAAWPAAARRAWPSGPTARCRRRAIACVARPLRPTDAPAQHSLSHSRAMSFGSSPIRLSARSPWRAHTGRGRRRAC